MIESYVVGLIQNWKTTKKSNYTFWLDDLIKFWSTRSTRLLETKCSEFFFFFKKKACLEMRFPEGFFVRS